jgi:predicted transposase YbfD/YdcC
LPNGAPSADTFRRVFEVLKPKEFAASIAAWTAALASSFAGQVVALDGKALKAAVDRASSTTPLHLLHAWAAEQGLLLGQELVAGAPGEVKAVPELLKRLEIEGAVVTMDANGCTAAVMKAVLEAKANCVLALKGNRAKLHDFVVKLFEAREKKSFRGVSTHRSKTSGHGRTEERVVRVLPCTDWPVSEQWQGLRAAVLVDRTRRTNGGEETHERHYYVTTLDADAERLAYCIRTHWSVENNLHWVLDVVFDEDHRRIRDEASAQNFALLARLSLSLLKRNPRKLSVAMKRRKAAWDPAFILEVLVGALPAI